MSACMHAVGRALSGDDHRQALASLPASGSMPMPTSLSSAREPHASMAKLQRSGSRREHGGRAKMPLRLRFLLYANAYMLLPLVVWPAILMAIICLDWCGHDRMACGMWHGMPCLFGHTWAETAAFMLYGDARGLACKGV